MIKKHIILRKRANPKVVNLPNGRSFVSKWERISRKQLPINIKVYDRVVNDQTGSGLGSNLVKAGFDLGAKALGSEFGKKLINKGIDNIPNLFKFGASKIKNKR